MCLILFAYDVHPRYRMILAANRDEFYERPALPLHHWEDTPEILAGRDLRQKGTWLGITRDGRLAALTNFRDPGRIQIDAPSRGDLVAGFLRRSADSASYLSEIGSRADAYNGFNLLVSDGDGVYYASNRGMWCQPLQPGVYGLSNHLLNTPWPKVHLGMERLKNLLTQEDSVLASRLEEMLQDIRVPADDQLPDTGVGLDWERLLAPAFITSPDYGTRCSSILTIDTTGHVVFKEITWEHARPQPCPASTCTFDFQLRGQEWQR